MAASVLLSVRMPRTLRTAVCAAVVAGTLLTAGCSSLDADEPGGAKRPTGSASAGSASAGTASAGSALDAVGELTVKGRSPKTGFSREKFGHGWVDTDGNGCGTRDDILKRDLSGETFRDDGCQIAGGVLGDPYTGRRIVFARGGRSEVDIDHVVALSDAWQKGAQRWTRDKRVEFANDPLNLLAAEASANRAKGDADTATWLPPDKTFRCAYVARQVAVKQKYGVHVTRAEKDAMARVLEGCPGERLPAAGRPDSPPRPSDTERGPGDVAYENCDAVRTAGKAPIRRGDPGYGPHLDRDGDGTACDT